MDVEKITPTVDDLLLLVSQSFLSSLDPNVDETAVTFCHTTADGWTTVGILLASLIIADLLIG